MNYNIEFKPLDILVYPPTGWSGKIISWFTGPLIHTGICMQIDGRNLQLEATYPKVDVTPVSALWTEGIWVRRMKFVDEMSNIELRSLNTALTELAFATWGELKYSVGNLLKFPVRVLLEKHKGADEKKLPKRAICSQFTSWVYSELLEIDLVPSIKAKVTSPMDIALSDELFTLTKHLRIIR